MNTHDERIAAALDEDDKAFLASLDEGRGMFTQIGDVLVGPLGGWSKLIFAVAFVLGFVLLYAGWRFFTAEASDEMVWWGAITLAVLMMQGFIKEWFYNRMNMLAILREVKKLQLQVALLSSDKG
ncbi:DUF6768 family protein [Erythrobacter sp. JK5]|uniref:DUF6768 family protein n=1 Tax=Erythrobacter sp. JK5 TaxID=2829500 RepID=UPI001BA8FAEF|nr:DUF6768 family protein [Erythrobacter sp. JK5]QUL36503.1 hypothetical protein KDC96_08580 [Erythrobacter sp. JK5]